MNTFNRRKLLGASGAGLASLGFCSLGYSSQAFASLRARRDPSQRAGDKKPVLVTVFLRGGADALNMIVPYGEQRYSALRPTLAVPSEDSDEGKGVLRLDKTFGLHPAFEPLLPFWKKGQLAPIVNVGSPHSTRSHFDAQDFMEYAAPGLRNQRAGWLNRYLASSAAERAKRFRKSTDDNESGVRLRALAMQGLLPRSLRGNFPVLAVPDNAVLADKEMLDLFGPLYGEMLESGMGDGPAEDDEADGGAGGAGGTGGDTESQGEERMEPRPEDPDSPVLAAGQNTLATLERFREIVGSGDQVRPGFGGRRGQLGLKLGQLAQVITSGEPLEVASIDVGGWDHHTNQGQLQGAQPRLIGEVSKAVAQFMKDLGADASRTLVLIMTEFGRTARENGNYGTDHGHGGMMLLVGGNVAGGEVHGDWAGLEDTDLYQGRDLAITTDFRDVFNEVLRKHMQFDMPKGYFPDYKPKRLKKLFS